MNEPELEILTIRFPKGMFNNLEQAVAQEVTIEFLHWLRGIRKGMPEDMRIAGASVGIAFSPNRFTVDYHDGECRRPKRLRWNVSVLLDSYQPTVEQAELLQSDLRLDGDGR